MSSALYLMDKLPLEERKLKCEAFLKTYPDKVPVLVSRLKGSTAQQIENERLLVPHELTVAQLIFIIRRRLKFPAEKALFLFVNGSIPSGTQTIQNIYNQYKNTNDGFLRVAYTEENVFG